MKRKDPAEKLENQRLKIESVHGFTKINTETETQPKKRKMDGTEFQKIDIAKLTRGMKDSIQIHKTLLASLWRIIVKGQRGKAHKLN